MNKSGYTILGIFAALAIIAFAGWMYNKNADSQPETSAPSPISIDAGIALFKEKKYAEAAEVFENIPPGHPQEWYSLYYLGSTYIMLKDYPNAVEHLELALALNPSETQIMHALGTAYFKLGNLKMSKAYYAMAVEIDPNDAEAKGLMDIMTRLERQQENHARAPEDTNG